MTQFIAPKAFVTAAAAPNVFAAPRLSTPRLLLIALAAITLSLAVFWVAGAGVIHEAKAGVQTIGRDTAPSVVAAQQIRASLAALDAAAVNAALQHGAAAADAWKAYETEERILSDHLVTAAQNITYGDDERNPIVEITAKLQVYADLIGQARALLAAADPRATAAPDAALGQIRLASAVMDNNLAPAAAALNAANEDVLERNWRQRNSAFGGENAVLIFAGLLGVAILIAAQVLVARRTRRQINPGLLAATILFAAVALLINYEVASSAAVLRSAKEDAFDSVRALWKTRATLYAANTDESYFLLDAARKQQYSDSFFAKLALVAGPGFDRKPSRDLLVAQARAFGAANCVAAAGQKKFAGFIGGELNNVTFEHECVEAANLYPLLAEYVAIDRRIRDLDAAGDHAGALSLTLGTNPGESDYAFAMVNSELGLLIYINQMEFDSRIKQATAKLGTLNPILAAGVLLAWLLTWLGVRLRLAEYRE